MKSSLSTSSLMPQITMLLSNPYRPDPRVLKEARSMAERGYPITIICWDREAEFPIEDHHDPGIQIQRIRSVPSNYGIGIRQVLHLPIFWKALLPPLHKSRPDIVHCHDFDTLPVGLWYGKTHQVPVVYDAHEYYADLVRPRLGRIGRRFVYPMIQAAERVLSRQAAKIITVDENLARNYTQADRSPLIVGHYPSATFVEKPATVFGGSELNLLYAGRLSRDRGLLVYIEILQILLRAGIPARLQLAGVFTPPEESENFQAAIRGLEGAVSYLGWITYDQMPGVLMRMDVGLAILQPEPRYVKALPVKMFEYMAAGLPVLASDFPGITQIINKWNCGAVVPPSLPQLAAEKLIEWWKEPQTPQALGKNGRRAVLAEYNWESLMDSLDQAYRSIL